MAFRPPCFIVIAALATLSTSSWALKQPNNVTIPTSPSLQFLFNSRGEGINALADAQIVPETFKPTCALEFQVLQRNAGFKNSFGWYNVTGAAPQPSDLHEFISCFEPAGTKKVLSILKDPNYKGGDIGFYQATGPCATPFVNKGIMYSEKKYNPDSYQQNPFIHLLVYNSTVTPKAFYFCWEDLFAGGDNDFDDLTMFVSGIGCTGSGAACNTGKLGICAKGSMECQKGKLECVPLVGPATEICDGLDNDCNGQVDEGNLCPANEVCDKGTCVPKCSGGEFQCPKDKVCSDKGLCVDPGCAKITCPANTKCDGGKCVGPCDGVVCPWGEVCLVGACVDPCTKFKCDPSQVCHLGACIEKCSCTGCKQGQTCMPDGLCLPNACVNAKCSKGTHCDDKGVCVDDCQGASCPKGETCKQGNCVKEQNGMQGSGGNGNDSSGSFMLGDGGAASESSSSSATLGAGGVDGAGFGRPNAAASCNCRFQADDDSRAAWLCALAAVAVVASRRRKRPMHA
jgi:hypothetical protein